MGVSGASTSRVSRLVAEIDERVNAFRTHPIEGEWRYRLIDAAYLKKPEGGRIVSMAVIFALLVNADDQCEVLDIVTGPSKAESFWKAFLRLLADRGLGDVKLVKADDHEGLLAEAGKAAECSGCAMR